MIKLLRLLHTDSNQEVETIQHLLRKNLESGNLKFVEFLAQDQEFIKNCVLKNEK
jgi:hypothetical protein